MFFSNGAARERKLKCQVQRLVRRRLDHNTGEVSGLAFGALTTSANLVSIPARTNTPGYFVFDKNPWVELNTTGCVAKCETWCGVLAKDRHCSVVERAPRPAVSRQDSELPGPFPLTLQSPALAKLPFGPSNLREEGPLPLALSALPPTSEDVPWRRSKQTTPIRALDPNRQGASRTWR